MEKEKSVSLELAKQFLGKEVKIAFDRPIGSRHPKHGFIYEVNYGNIEGVKAPDGEDLDAYYLGTNQPLKDIIGIVKAIVHRLNDDDDKLIVMPKDISMTNDEINQAINFQEQWFEHQIIR